MTVEQAVKECEGRRVYIGFSSGWAFIGTAEEFEEQIDNLSKEAKERLKMKLNFQPYKDPILQDYLFKWKPYRKRKVLLMYEKEVEGGIGIKAEGLELSPYWLHEEWRRDYDKGKLKKVGFWARDIQGESGQGKNNQGRERPAKDTRQRHLEPRIAIERD